MEELQEIKSPITNNIYKLIKIIGSGTYAQCWEAINLNLNIKICLKINEFLDEQQQKQVEQEACLHATLIHDSIVRFHECFYYNDYFILVMDLAQCSLDTYLASNKIATEEQILYLIFDISSAITYLHQRNIIHRDISAKNLLIFPQFRLKLCDFGVSSVNLTAKTQIGTPQTMAPEIFDGKYSQKVDIWAMGCVFYQILTGNNLFNGNLMGLIKQIENFKGIDEQFSFSQQFNEFSKELLNQMLQVNPEKRITAEQCQKKIIQRLKFLKQIKYEDNLFKEPLYIDFVNGEFQASHHPPALKHTKLALEKSVERSQQYSTRRLNIEELKRQAGGKKGGFDDVQIFTGLDKLAEEKVNRGE